MEIWSELYQQSQLVDLSKESIVATQFNHELDQAAIVDGCSANWVASPAAGVVRILLEREGGEKTTRATSLVAYQPGSQFAAHSHPMGEEFLVLSGVFSDEYGNYPAGSYVRNPPGSSHQPFSREGCLIFVKLQQFDLEDRQRIVLDTGAITGSDEVWFRQVLFEGYEHVSAIYAAEDTVLPSDLFSGQGLELLIISGTLVMSNQDYRAGHWMRLPDNERDTFEVKAGTRLFVKRNHLVSG